MNAGKMALSALAGIFALAATRGAEVLTDDEVKERIVQFVRLPSLLCGHAAVDFRNELRTRKLTNRSWFDGDTNRLARLICELAQTNDVKIAGMMIRSLGEYGTPAQLPFLYSCSTNPVVGDRAVKAVLRIEGVTSNSVEAIGRYFSLTNCADDADMPRTSICAELIRLSKLAGVDAICRSNALDVAQHFSVSPDCNYYWMDKLLINDDPSYRYSRRRLGYMRSVATHAAQWEFQLNYVTNAINELVAYPEANLPE